MRLRILWWWLLALVLVSVTALSGGYAWLQTAGGKRWLADQIAAAASTPEGRLAIGALDGVIPFSPVATGVSLSDSGGEWLTVDRASIQLDPLALLNRVALFEAVDLGRMAMLRQPIASSSATEGQSAVLTAWPISWPELPVDLEIKHLSVAEFALGASILDEPASFSIEGAVRLGDLRDGLSLDLAVDRTDDSPGILTARVRYVPATAQLTTMLRLNEPEGGVLARLAGLSALSALTFDLFGEGTLDDWEAELRIDGGDDLRLEAMAAIVTEETGRRVTVDATGRLATFADAAWRPLVNDETALGASVLIIADDNLRFDRFDLSGGFGAASLTGELDLTDETANVALTLVASEPDRFAQLTEAAVSWSALQLSATATGPYRQPALALTFEGDDLVYRGFALRSIVATVDGAPSGPLTDTRSRIEGVADLSIDGLDPGAGVPKGLLEPSTHIAASGSITLDGALVVDSLELTGASVSIWASGAIDAEILGMDWRVSLADLAAVDPSLGGNLTAEGRLSGTVEDPTTTARLLLIDAELAGYPVSEMEMTAEFEDLTGQPTGRIGLEGEIANLPVQATADMRFQDDGIIRIDTLTLQLASLAAEGTLELDSTGTATNTASGRVSLNIANLADLAPLIGETLSGQLEALVSLSQAGGRQIVDATVSATDTGLPDRVTAGRVELTLHLSDALTAPGIQARLQADGILAGGLDLDRMVVAAEGTMDRLAVAVDLADEMIVVDTQANLSLADGETRIEIAALRTGYAGTEAGLAGPARVTLSPNAVFIDDLVLQADGGRLRLNGRYGEISDLSLTLSDIPLELSHFAAPDLGLSGRLDGSARLTGTRGAPRASADFTITDVTLALLRELGIGELETTAVLDWDGQVLGMETTVSGDFDGSMTASATLLAPPHPATGLPVIDDSSSLAAKLSGGVDLGRLNDLLAARGDRVGGAVAVDLTLSGRVAEPRVAGTLRLTGGRYRSALTGVLLDDIVAHLNGDGGRLRIAELSAKAPNGGAIEASGSIGIDPDAGFPAEMSLEFDDALVINNDIVSAEVAGGLDITGELVRSLDVVGRLTVVEAEIRLPDRLPAQIQTLEVEEINVPPELEARRPTAPSAAQGGEVPLPIVVDLAIDAPERIFVRGRGLDAEVAGEVTIRGNADAPEIGGGFRLRRGFLNTLGRRFNFDEGVVTLPEDGSLDADIRFVARTNLNDVSAQLIVSGRASAPRITVESVPDLPQDEILARILFGRRASSLTAFESIWLARSAAELAGIPAGPDVLGGVRGALGLDVVDIERQGDGVGSAMLNVSGRIRDRVTLGVQQGLRAGSGRVGVQIELTPNISLDTDVGVNSTGRLGISKEWEY